jgi:subtilisin family serine protease
MQFWNRDRINSRANDCDYRFAEGSAGIVHVYVLDSGIKATHSEFASRVGEGYSPIGGASPYDDCHGHGTAVSGVAGGATFGVGKSVILHPVRIWQCSPAIASSDFINGTNWIRNRVVNERLIGIYHPTIVIFSGEFPLAGGATIQLEEAVFDLINEAQVLFVSIAGNGGGDASQVTPGRMSWVLQVAATTSNDSRLLTNPISNYGSTVDLFAPGDTIVTAGLSGAVAASGTSFAAPLVAGVASLARERTPWASDLAGKAVSLEAATGFTFDTLMVPRPR